MKIRTIALFFFLLLSMSCSRDIVILSYNVNNLFDDKNDGTEYPEFKLRPGHWSTELYSIRLHALAEVIKKSAPSGPAVIALQEIENQNVLDSLASLLAQSAAYPYRCIVPAAGSPTNTAILSKYPIHRVGAYSVRPYNNQPLRNILEAEIGIEGETLFVFCNHWKSREGGVSKTETARLDAALTLKKRLAAICLAYPDAQIVVAGDLNESANEYEDVKRAYQTAIISDSPSVPDLYSASSIFVTGDRSAATVSGKIVMYDPWLDPDNHEKGSYVFGKQWETIDHVLLSRGLCDDKGLSFVNESFQSVTLSFLVDTETGFPLRWDPRLKKGYSDHLPVLVKLRLLQN